VRLVTAHSAFSSRHHETTVFTVRWCSVNLDRMTGYHYVATGFSNVFRLSRRAASPALLTNQLIIYFKSVASRSHGRLQHGVVATSAECSVITCTCFSTPQDARACPRHSNCSPSLTFPPRTPWYVCKPLQRRPSPTKSTFSWITGNTVHCAC
jgi:hypothetical protein